ncbi:hypothetical protein GS399_16120 [Pedobacter sp. HMF7647]|uniref:Uncharacterized protein n=1 Tax=Hufsiella arboris TaxID=2695275 RepID=A0A7K1YD37_9SPHI|nr:hypothetical protein [Hufsiella arboris]
MQATTSDFYYENGFIVFTETYHLKRGFCCKNGCRHCPWKKHHSGKNRKQQNK